MHRLALALALCTGCLFGEKEAREGEDCGSKGFSNDVVCGGESICYRGEQHSDMGVCRRPCAASTDCQQGERCVHGVCRAVCASGQRFCGQPRWCAEDRSLCMFAEICCIAGPEATCATPGECLGDRGIPVSQ